MKQLEKMIRLVVVLLFVLGSLQTPLSAASALEPARDAWFTETITIGPVDLPVGITLTPSDPMKSSRASIMIENQTSTVLYILSLSYKDLLVMVTPDPLWKNRVSAAHEVASYLSAPQRPLRLDMIALVDLDRNLVDRNVLTSDPPPSGLLTPEPQSSELLMVYGDKVIEVPFTLTYAINMRFDNGSTPYPGLETPAQANNDASCAATQQALASVAQVAHKNRLAIGLSGGLVLLLAGWLVWKLKRHG